MPLKIETSCSPYVAANQSLQAWTEITSKRPALDTAIDSVIVKNIARDNLESPRPHLVLAARLQNSLSGSANAVQACRLRFPKTYPVCFCEPKSASFTWSSMSKMFSGSGFNQPLNDWGNNLGKVENMSSMFAGSYFNQPLNEWNVRNVEDMSSMFAESIFNQPLNDWGDKLGNVKKNMKIRNFLKYSVVENYMLVTEELIYEDEIM